MVTKGFTHQRRDESDKTGVTAQLHLKAQTLALVQTHRACLPHRLAEPRAWQVLLVAAVSCFVHGAHQAAEEIVCTEPCGHAHVFGHTAAKRMCAHVQTPGFKVEAQAPHHGFTQAALRRHRKRPDRFNERFARLFGRDTLNEPGQPLANFTKHMVQLRGGHAGLELVEQGVVARHPGLVGQQLRCLPGERQDLAKVAHKTRPVVGRALLAPSVFATRRGQLQLGHQGFGQGIAGAPLAADLAQVGTLKLVQWLLLGQAQLTGQLRCGAHAVQQGRHLGHCSSTCLVALGRHVGSSVPTHDGLQVAQVVQPRESGGQCVVRRCVH